MHGSSAKNGRGRGDAGTRRCRRRRPARRRAVPDSGVRAVVVDLRAERLRVPVVFRRAVVAGGVRCAVHAGVRLLGGGSHTGARAGCRSRACPSSPRRCSRSARSRRSPRMPSGCHRPTCWRRFAPLALGRSWAVVVAGLALSSIAPRGVPVTVAAGVGASYAALLALKPLIAAAPVIVYALLPMLSLALVARPVEAARRELSSLWSTSPSELALTNPSSFPSPGNRLFACIALFEVAFGFSIQFGADAAAWQQDVAALGRARARGGMVRAHAPPLARGRAVLSVGSARGVRVLRLLGVHRVRLGRLPGGAFGGRPNVQRAHLGDARHHCRAQPRRRRHSARDGGSAPRTSAPPAGVALGGLPVGAQDAALADARLLALALVAVGACGLRVDRSSGVQLSDAIQGVLPVEAVAAPSPEAAIEARCAHLAAAHGLTSAKARCSRCWRAGATARSSRRSAA